MLIEAHSHACLCVLCFYYIHFKAFPVLTGTASRHLPKIKIFGSKADARQGFKKQLDRNSYEKSKLS